MYHISKKNNQAFPIAEFMPKGFRVIYVILASLSKFAIYLTIYLTDHL